MDRLEVVILLLLYNMPETGCLLQILATYPEDAYATPLQVISLKQEAEARLGHRKWQRVGLTSFCQLLGGSWRRRYRKTLAASLSQQFLGIKNHHIRIQS